jgi:hypothetical protein
MKRLHRPDIFGWSEFNEDRNIDFHSVVWVRPAGNVVIDPLALSDHDEAHLRELGGVAWIVVTNSDHVRDSGKLAERTGALPCLNRAVKITFAQVESVVSQQVVGGRHMKIEIRQHKAQQIALAGKFHGVTPELYFELTSLATLELFRFERRKKIP